MFVEPLCMGISESSDGKKKKANPQFVKSDCLISIEIMVGLAPLVAESRVFSILDGRNEELFLDFGQDCVWGALGTY